jgi:hypothetical protein
MPQITTRRASRWLTTTLTVLAISTSASWAMAQDAESQPAEDDYFTLGTSPGWYMLGGLTGGGSFGTPGGGGFVGAEVSVVRLHKGLWTGLYVDGMYDFNQGAIFTAGPEIGYYVAGLDGGVALRLGDQGPEVGGAARALLSLGLFSLYGRYMIWPTGGELEHVGQVGVLLKIPLMEPRGFDLPE